MSDPMTRNRDASAANDRAPRRRRSPLLWILVLLAIIAAAWYFAGRQRSPEPASPSIGETRPVPSESPVSDSPAQRGRPAP